MEFLFLFVVVFFWVGGGCSLSCLVRILWWMVFGNVFRNEGFMLVGIGILLIVRVEVFLLVLGCMVFGVGLVVVLLFDVVELLVVVVGFGIFVS